MNINLFRKNWRMFYKRAFITTFIITLILTMIDQGLSSPLFAIKIVSIKSFIDACLQIFYFSVGSGILATITLMALALIRNKN
ncbi:hypothetical protein OAQ08_00890 [Alphaproteobacteria bacterium]|nr:hypothetical protein [Alphaproteobacteria bacterium]